MLTMADLLDEALIGLQKIGHDGWTEVYAKVNRDRLTVALFEWRESHGNKTTGRDIETSTGSSG